MNKKIIMNKKNIMNQKNVLATALVITILTQSGMPLLRVSAAEVGQQKEEVVYIMTDAAGRVDSVDVVNIFGKGSVTDYGAYSSVKMLNTTDAIELSGDQVTFSTDKDKVYYQGTLEDAQIPWKITLTYTLDGKEVSPEELAGSTGALCIHLKIEKNTSCTTDFYDAYALQASMTLDTQNCKNILADGATLANVGSDKQISYTVLPGKGLDAYVYTDVSDFEMDAVTINGVKLNLDIDIDDDELMDQVTQIMDAAKDINDGAGKLSDGSGELLDGSSSLSDGAKSLSAGAQELADGIKTLHTGTTSMQQALKQLDAQSDTLTNGSAAVEQGIADACDGAKKLQTSISYDSYAQTLKDNGLDLLQLQTGNKQAVQLIAAQTKQLQASLKQLKSQPGYEEDEDAKNQAAQLQSQIESLSTVSMLLQGNSAALDGTQQYLNAAADGAKQLSSGMSELKSSYRKMDDGIAEYTDGVGKITAASVQLVTGTQQLSTGSQQLVTGLSSMEQGTSDLYDGIVSLDDGTKELNDGTNEFYEKTDDMDTQVEDAIDGMVGSLSGGDAKTESFVSEKNKNVSSVQFVIKTDAIEKTAQTQSSVEETQKLSFWEKLVRLFQ